MRLPCPRRRLTSDSHGVERLLDHLAVQAVDLRCGARVAFSLRHAGPVLDEQPDPR